MERPNLVVRLPGYRRSGPDPDALRVISTPNRPATSSAWETNPVGSGGARTGKLIGLGSGDMKAAVAAMVYALGGFEGGRVLRPASWWPSSPPTRRPDRLLGSKWLADNGLLEADVAIIGEPSGVEREWESLHLVSRGRGPVQDQDHRHPDALVDLRPDRGDQRHRQDGPPDRPYGPGPRRATSPTSPHPALPHRPDRQRRASWPRQACSTGCTRATRSSRATSAPCREWTSSRLIDDINRFLASAMAEDPDLRAELVWELMVPGHRDPGRTNR